MTGGLEPYGWIYETFAPGAGWCAPPEWWPATFTRTPPNPKTTRNVIALYTAPAEPAEARIRELVDQLLKTERDYSELRQSYDAVVAKLTIERGHGDKQYRRASAAEAKLARAVEALRMARDALSTAKMWAKRKGGCDGAIDKIDRSLFAIKQTLAALAHPPAQGSEAIRRAAEAARDALKCEGPEHELIHQRDYFALDRIATGPNLQRALAAALSPQPGPASEGDGE